MDPKAISLLQSGHLSDGESLTFALHAHFNLRTYQVEGSGIGRRSVRQEQAREYDGEERNTATSEVLTERGQMFETSNGERMRSDSFATPCFHFICLQPVWPVLSLFAIT